MLLARGILRTLSCWIRGSRAQRGSSRAGNVIDFDTLRPRRGIRRATPSLAATAFALILVAIGAFAGVSSLFPDSRAPGQRQPWVALPPSTMRPHWVPESRPDTQLAPPARRSPFHASATFRLAIHGVEADGGVSDGDTLRAGHRRIRLNGIDAPERDQVCERQGRSIPCGRLAAETLEAFLAGQRIACNSAGVDRYGRDLSTCFRSNGVDVNRYMVASGWAVAYGRYSRAYEQAEAEARLRRLGLWAGSFVLPEEWRAGRR